MNVDITRSNPCWRCNSPYLRQTVREEVWIIPSNLAVVEIHTVIRCVRCGTILRENCRAREFRLEE